jgi:hypothetical protein
VSYEAYEWKWKASGFVRLNGRDLRAMAER